LPEKRATTTLKVQGTPVAESGPPTEGDLGGGGVGQGPRERMGLNLTFQSNPAPTPRVGNLGNGDLRSGRDQIRWAWSSLIGVLSHRGGGKRKFIG